MMRAGPCWRTSASQASSRRRAEARSCRPLVSGILGSRSIPAPIIGPMSRVTGGRAVADALVAEGVEVVFGIPGEHTIPLYDGLYHHRESIRHILPRHEQGAGFMAEGYAMATGNVGVCITTTGPGAFNALTAL